MKLIANEMMMNVWTNWETMCEHNTCCTAESNCSSVFAFFLYWMLWIAWKNLKSKMLKSGELGGWEMRWISKPTCYATSKNNGSSNFRYDGALSCCPHPLLAT
jgi:hypothetical protein